MLDIGLELDLTQVLLSAPAVVSSFESSLPVNATFVRNSLAYQYNGAAYTAVITNAPRYSSEGLGVFIAASQLIPNASGFGSDTTTSTPVGWSGFGTTNGVTISIIDRDTIKGLPAVKIRISGLCTTTSSATIFFNAATASPAVQNNTLNMSMFIRQTAGDIGNARFRFAYVERTSAGSAAKATTYSNYFTFNSVSQRFDRNYLVTEATTAFLQVGFNIALSAGETYNLDILIACPQLTLTSIPTPPWPSDPFDQVTISGANLIRNLVSGAVVGTPGTLPTNWLTSLASGITREVVAVGTNYIDIRLSGTISVATSSVLLWETATQIAAVKDDVVGIGTNVSLVGGSLTNVISITFTAIEYSSAPAVLVNNNGVALPVSTTPTHFSNRFVLSNASTASVCPGLRFSFTVGQPVDLTIRITLAVLQKNANIVLYSDHPAEVLTAALGPASDAMSLALNFTPGRILGAFTLLQIHEGAGQRGIRIRSTDGYDLIFEILNGGSVVDGPFSLCNEGLYSTKESILVVAWDSTGAMAKLNNLPAATSTVNPLIPADAIAAILNNASGTQQTCGEVSKLRTWNSRLPSSSLIRIVTETILTAVLNLMYGQSIGTGSGGFFPSTSTNKILQDFATPTLRENLLLLSTLPTVYGGQSDVRLGTNRTNGSAIAADQVVLPNSIINFEPFVSRQLTTSSNAQTPLDSSVTYLIDSYDAAYHNRAYLIAASLAVGGTQIANLRKVPSILQANGHVPYNDIITTLDRTVALSQANGLIPRVDFVDWFQGETDSQLNTSTATYLSELQGLQAELNLTIKSATGQTFNPVWLSGSFSMFEAGETGPSIALAKAQQQGIITLCTPYYPFYYNSVADGFDVSDYIHLNGVGYTWLGEYANKVKRAWITEGRKFSPTIPTNITKSGTTYRLSYACEVAPLVLDDITVTNPGNYGFQVFDSSNNLVTISSVSLGSSGKDIIIETSSDPGDGSEIAYALIGYASVPRNPAFMPRGCVRDSDPAVSELNSCPLWNWGVHFRLGVS